MVRFGRGDIYRDVVGFPVGQEWNVRREVDVIRWQIKRLERAS